MIASEALADNGSRANTYVAGEDASRLASSAKYFGLQESRKPSKNIRQAVNSLFHDDTFSSAMMHSVGKLGRNERVDSHGALHLMTTVKRPKQKKPVGASGDYDNLMDLFHGGEASLKKDTGPPKQEDDDDEEEIVVEDIVEGGSLTAAAFGIVKGTVGPAILYLPRGFKMAGYAVAIPSLCLATFSYLYSALRLLQSWKVESERMRLWESKLEEVRALLDPESVNYGSTNHNSKPAPADSRSTLLSYPELARRAFGKSSIMIQIGIASMQFGVCLTYLIYVPQNLYEVAIDLFGIQVSKLYFLLIMLLIEIPLCWIRDIRKLTPTNVLATFLIAYGLLSCIIIAVMYGLSPSSDLSSSKADIVDNNDTASFRNTNIYQNLMTLPAYEDTWFLFVGTSFFVFEGSITLLVPLQEAVYRDEDKEKFPTVNRIATLWIMVFYIFFAMICWVSLGGSHVRTALTASLPAGIFSTIVQFAYSVAVILTFPLQAYPALEVTCGTAKTKIGDENNYDIIKHNFVVTLIVLALGVIAVLAIDYLGNVVSLLGSVVGVPLALIFPPLIHNKLVQNSATSTRMMNYAVATIGFAGMIATSITTIMTWDKGAES